MSQEAKYPDQYLHVRQSASGQEWIRPLRATSRLDITHQVKRWIKDEFDSEYRLDGDIMSRIEGDFYAQIITDGRPPNSIVVWDSGGFYLRGNYNE